MQVCQSCGMPLSKPEDFGTNLDGSESKDFCRFCFQKGRFTEPGITMLQMIEKAAGFLVSLEKMPEAEAKKMAEDTIPKLKRWRSKGIGVNFYS